MVPLNHTFWNQKVIARMIFSLIRSGLHGCNHTSTGSWTRPRLIEKAGLARNTVRSFLLGTDQNIGTLTGVRIWHDCRGKSPEWYLHRITVENLSNGEVFWFLCERWLAGFSFSANWFASQSESQFENHLSNRSRWWSNRPVITGCTSWSSIWSCFSLATEMDESKTR